MRRLLWADRRAVRNALRLPQARGVLAANAIGWLLLGLGGYLAGARVFLAAQVRHALRDAPESIGPPLLLALLVLPLGFAASIALPEVARLLFREGSELLRAAPLRSGTIVGHAFVRAWLQAMLAMVVLGVPTLCGVIARTRALAPLLPAYLAAAGLLLLPLCAAATLTVCLASVLASGPRTRVIVNVLGFALGTGLALLFLAGLVAGREEAKEFLETLTASGAEPAWMLALGGLLAWSGGLVPWSSAGIGVLWAPLPAVPLLSLAARLYPAAWERSRALAVSRPRASARVRRWPHAVARSLLRRDLVTMLRARATLGGLGFLGAIAVVFLASSLLARRSTAEAHGDVLVALEMLRVWVILAVMLGAMQGGALLSNEGEGFDLLAASPASRRALLRGKLLGILLPYAWLALVVTAAAPFLRGASAEAIGLWLAGMPPLTLIVLAVVLGVGTLPVLHPSSKGPGAHSARFLCCGLAVMVPTIGLVVLLAVASSSVRAWAALPGAGPIGATLWAWLAAAWGVGCGLGWTALRVAQRNLRVVLGPRE